MSQADTPAPIPTVLSFNYHDSTAASGVTADVEAIASQGCHANTVITCLSVQDSQSVSSLIPVDDDIIVQSARAVLEDNPVAAIKIGLIGSEEGVEAIHEILLDYPKIPVVFNPMLVASNGMELAEDVVIESIRELLVPVTSLLTLNSLEAAMLFPEADNQSAMMQGLMDAGCDHILLSGRREASETVMNSLYHNLRVIEQYEWPRLSGEYYGAGCTLSASLAALLAVGLDIIEASGEAQNYCWQSLKNSARFGMGQFQPSRFYWMHENEDSD
ncbi:MAG: hydroxymethylpyrimidine/phosphomethylpyrimidine kinase [Gammaproteobacteria bacterium]|nr:hydroxymethylpyrimidine/phosphomethylpyrimidine kinase [Gammaproteobacteria bacterium]